MVEITGKRKFYHGKGLEGEVFSLFFSLEAKKGYKRSYMWSSIMESKWLIEEGCLWKVGNGRTIKVFKDKRIPNVPRNCILPI